MQSCNTSSCVRGSCVLRDGNYSCTCNFLWVGEHCDESYFAFFKKGDEFYYIVGVILFLPVMLLGLLELFLHLKHGARKKSFVFIVKVLTPLVGLFRVVYFLLYGYQSLVEKLISPIFIAETVIFNIGISLGVGSYFLVILCWIHLVEKIKTLPSSKTKFLYYSKRIIVVICILYSSGVISFGLYKSIIGNRTSMLLYVTWLVGFLSLGGICSVVLIFLLFSHIWILRQETKQTYKEIFKKNLYFLLITVMVFGICILMYIGPWNANGHPWEYIYEMFVLRMAEVVMLTCSLLIVQVYSFDYLRGDPPKTSKLIQN
eukprot:TRINITY_DN18315_c0_g1_i1.p1 TRINITY_DN18315_c0_g1~~TRINITY_DN18315_c0_g1_i1.p1  ORF type:complete len:316 (+),score=21.89 TRINITY_DN18315_c0_g1_i1:53-1000(+)